MSQTNVHLAFLWHMHQPWYVDPASDRGLLPWVRLHAIGAYTDMARVLGRWPGVRATLSISPSLLDQIQRYAAGAEETEPSYRDTYEEITRRPAEELTPEEREFLVGHFFSVHWGRVPDAMPHYGTLLAKRGRDLPPGGWGEAASRFSVADLRDLQLLFNLAWFGFSSETDPELAELVARGHGYSEEDKQVVLAKQRRTIRDLLPAWRGLVDRGGVEVACTPYYHGILPLLIDSNTAKRSNPEVNLPERFAAPEDATAQIARSIDRLERAFGTRPSGLWPAEAAISPEVVQLAHGCGLRYVATDAEILFHSLDDRGSTPGRSRLYQPYRAGEVAVLFRDEHLSTLIARDYASWDDSRAAAASFVEQVLCTAERARVDCRAPPLVLVALDGENPWEAYPGRGGVFLGALYELLAAHPRIRTVTLDEHLAEYPPSVGLDYLDSGSWIEANFDIWIGDAEKNRAWNLLGRARSKLTREHLGGQLVEGQLHQAQEHLYRAECSDWFWWLGEPFSSAEDPIYESLFRSHLMAVYRALGDSPPADLSRPIVGGGGIVTTLRQPTSFIRPRIDGVRTSYFEWRGAGYYRTSTVGSGTSPFITGLYWGFDPGRLYLRLDPADPHLDGSLALGEVDVVLVLTEPGRSITGRLELAPTPRLALTAQGKNGEQSDLGLVQEVAFLDVVELAIPLARLGLQSGDRLGFTVHFGHDGRTLADVPRKGVIEIEVPGDEFGI